jgi:zinc protease
MAGDFDAQAMLARLEELYADIPMGSGAVPHPARPEPALTAEQRVEVHGPGQTTYMQVVYRAPAAAEMDFFAFTVMDSLLTGPSGLNMFGGGGISNKTSRIYRALVEKELAVSAYGGLQATIDPHLYDITITVHPRRTVARALASLDDQIHRLQDELVSMDEIERAVKQARAMFAYGSENITNQAFWLGYAEMFDHYDWFLEYTERLSRITPQDVQRIAQVYLNPARRVVGVYVPEEEK